MARKRATSAAPAWASDPQYQAFETDITAHPDDDTPRLVLADWLEEHGDAHTAARAEFIRVQIELASLSAHDLRREDLTRRQDELLRMHEHAWLGGLAEVVTDAVWQRGFPQRMRLGVRAFMDNADELFRQAPILHLQLLRISQTKLTMEDLAACPHFGRLRGLSLPGSSIGDDKLSVLLGRSDLRNLETLELSSANVGQRTLQAIVDAQLPRLRRLDLSSNILEFVIQRLFRDKTAFELHDLDLSSVLMNEQDQEAFFRWAKLATVETLSLSNNRLGVTGGRHLATSPYLNALRSLDLSMCEIGAGGVRALAEAGALPQVRELGLGHNHIRPSGFEAFLNCAFVGNLRALRLTCNLLGDASIERLARWPGLFDIHTLELRLNSLGAVGVEALCSSPHLGSPRALVLSDNQIGSDGARAIAVCSRLAGLRRLDLTLCDIGEEGGEAILDSPHLAGLERLALAGNVISRPLAKRLNARFKNATHTF